MMEGVAVGALKTAKVMNLRCLGEGCESNHETYDCKDVLFLMEAIPLEDAQNEAVLAACLADGRMAATKSRAIPTMLGIWWEAVCDN